MNREFFSKEISTAPYRYIYTYEVQSNKKWCFFFKGGAINVSLNKK